MIKSILISTILFFALQRAIAQQPDIIPLPDHFSKVDADFVLSSGTVVTVQDKEFEKVALFFQQQVLEYTGISLPLKTRAKDRSVSFIKRKKSGKEPESYSLEMNDKYIIISSSTDRGAFDGAVSLLQLIRKGGAKENAVNLSCWKIEDKPLYSWRGFMLDESRHFMGKTKVKSLLDWMAYYKLNRFHWHLTDQNGWRIEIKKYPKLALVGGIGNYTDPFTSATFYTQEDIKEIVQYAGQRFIEVIPEIDMPGHARAANMAYPEYSGGGTPKYPDYTFNPGKESTYSYLSNVLKEINVLFPSHMIHMGGDEVSYGNKNWETDSDVKALMQQHALADIAKVEQYFVSRMADSIRELNNKVLVWDEAVDTNLPINETLVFWWRQNKPEQLKKALDKGFSVVLCPRLPLYFDFVQDSLLTNGRKWEGKFNSLEDVYSFSPNNFPGTRGHEDLVKGIQANLWTETIPGIPRLDFMLFPRICALAEAAWTSPEKRNFKLFENRLKPELGLFKKSGLNFYEKKYMANEIMGNN